MDGQIRIDRTTISLLVCVLFVGCASDIEEVTKLKSPDGKWVLSEEYHYSTSNYQIVLRDSSRKEIAKGIERHVRRNLIDLPIDYSSQLELTNDMAGTKDQPLWRLDLATGNWSVASGSDNEIKGGELRND